jgi:hypothetical protein
MEINQLQQGIIQITFLVVKKVTNHAITEELIKPATITMVHIIFGEKTKNELPNSLIGLALLGVT